MPAEVRNTELGRAISRQVFNLKELVRPYYLKWLYFRLGKDNCPDNFKKCWQFPSRTVCDSSAAIKPEDGDHPDVVFLPMADWHTCVQRTQHFAATFASLGHRCFYMNPHLGREFPGTYFRSPRTLVTTLAPRIYELHVHLFREPVFHHRCLRSDESELVVQAIEELLGARRLFRPWLIVSFPVWGDVAAELHERLGGRIIYDCHDLLTGFGNISEDLLEAEGRVLSRCELVSFSAQWLMDHTLAQYPDARDKAVLVRNAVNHYDFDMATVFRNRINDTDNVKTIGYVGALNFWFDIEAVRFAALAHPEWRFLLVGPIGSQNIDVLRNIPNVVFRGAVPHAELSSYLSQMDVATIPFLKTPLTMGTNPIKLYEYFACGLPVVSTRLPEVEGFPDLIYIADSPAQFSTQIEVALRETDPSLRARRISIARQESWLARCMALSEAMRQRGAL